MRLTIAFAPGWQIRETAAGTEVQAGPDLALLVGAMQPVPYNARQWGDRVVFGALPPARLKVHSLEDAQGGG